MLKYIEISDDIRNSILTTKQLTSNDKLSSEIELCKKYKVSKMTIKKALDLLVDEGLIYKKRGHGTFVKGLSNQQLTSIQDNYNNLNLLGFTNSHPGQNISTIVIDFSIIHPTIEIATNLKISESEFVYKIYRVRLIDGIPNVFEETYMPINLIQGLNRTHLEASIYSYINEKLKYKIQSAHIRVYTRRASEFVADLLQINVADPISEVKQVAFLNNGQAFEYSISHHRPETYEFATVIVKK